MDVADKNEEALSRHDVKAMALYIYGAKIAGQQNLVITLHGFNFQCDLQSGDISSTLTQVGGVNQKLGQKSAEGYIFSIKHALTFASRIHLLTELKMMDAALTAAIHVDVKSGAHLDERSVNNTLGKLAQVKGVTLTTITGMFSARTPQSYAMKIVRDELHSAARFGIHTFNDVDKLCETIRQKLTGHQPAPEKNLR